MQSEASFAFGSKRIGTTVRCYCHWLSTTDLMGEQIGNESDKLWIKPYEADIPRVPHPASDLTERLMKAYTQRLVPPENFPDFQ